MAFSRLRRPEEVISCFSLQGGGWEETIMGQGPGLELCQDSWLAWVLSCEGLEVGDDS